MCFAAVVIQARLRDFDRRLKRPPVTLAHVSHLCFFGDPAGYSAGGDRGVVARLYPRVLTIL